ncbi:DUF2306 domain-containing protein [Caulobacter henricii]|uniref:DUF2306 domain-containing protein n=1 Tax=Caulobacter henricii TaxID=69395 RepID=A0A0P0P382_9CAUL|nr:DUF2306 domain-containing protein [Caulobacter henricii]ALL14675.1 hypothetical protein AQ619_15655 [Caulobacter henricii]
MADQDKSMQRPTLSGRFGVLALGAATLAILAASPGVLAAPLRVLQGLGFRPHAPDLGLLAAAPLVIQLHVAGAVTAFVIGAVLLAGVKGTGLHKALGWTWVLAMTLTAVSSLFIRTINPGHFSLIHLLSGWTLIALPMAIFAIKRRKVRQHARAMTGMFVGGLLIAGLFTFLPGRLMWHVFLG